MSYRDAWQKGEHSKQFAKAVRANNAFLFVHKFQRYLPARCLNYVLGITPAAKISMFDIGCAAGDFYGYLTYLPMFSKVTYEGFDISNPAIDLANKYYSTDVFKLINSVDELEGRIADVVLSVDVIPHQLRPFEHLETILECARRYLVVSLRTRDVGKTVLDPELSCQRNYGEWVPWIVINTNELYSKIIQYSEKPVRIICFKEYIVFGGEGRRFLPKELYLEDSRTAVSTLIIEKCNSIRKSEAIEYYYKCKTNKSYTKAVFFSKFGSCIKKLGFDKFITRIICERLKSIDEVLKHTTVINSKKINLDTTLN